MVNNNTNKTTVTTVTVSESNIYVKQSDLNKMTLGSFKNDVGYISATALAAWMKEHAYLSKNEITALINKANLVVIDSINKEYDENAVERLNADISDIKGEIVAIKDKLRDIDGDYIKADKENSLATKTDVRIINSKLETVNTQINNLGDSISSLNFAKKSEIPRKVSQLENDKGYLTEHQSLAGLAKKTDLNKYVTSSDAQRSFATKEEMNSLEIPSVAGLASETWVEDFVNGKGYLTKHQSLAGLAKVSQIPDVSGLAEKSEIPTKVSQLENDKGYLTKHQSLAGLAKVSQIPDVSGLAEKSEIPTKVSQLENDKGYLTKHQSLAGLAKTSDLKGLASEKFVKDYVADVMENAEELDMSIYAKNTDLNKLNSAITSLSKSLKGYAKTSDIPDVSGFVKKDELPTTDTSGLASKEWVENQNYLKSQSLKGYAKESSLKDMATQTWVTNQIENIINNQGTPADMSIYAKLTDIPKDYVSTQALNTALKKYALSKDIPSMDGLATEAWVQENFLSEAQDLSEYVKRTELSKYVDTKTLNSKLAGYAKTGSVYTKEESRQNFLSQSDADSKYLKKSDAKDEFISKSEVKRDYLKIEDYRGLREMVVNQEILKDALVINDDYTDKTLEWFTDYVENNTVTNGFYLLEDNQLCIVQGNTILGVIKDGVPQGDATLYWEEE